MQLASDKASRETQIDELQARFSRDSEVLHQQLSEANAKLAMAAEALRVSGQQTLEITNLEQQLRAAGKQREEDRMKIVSMDAQLSQTASGSKVMIPMQTDCSCQFGFFQDGERQQGDDSLQ